MKQFVATCLFAMVTSVAFAQANQQQAVPIDELIRNFLSTPTGVKWSDVTTKFPKIQWNEVSPKKDQSSGSFLLNADISVEVNGKIPRDNLKMVIVPETGKLKKNQNYGKRIKWGVVLTGTPESAQSLFILNQINTGEITSPQSELKQILQKLGLSAAAIACDEGDNDWNGGKVFYRLNGASAKEVGMLVDWSCGNAGCSTTLALTYDNELGKRMRPKSQCPRNYPFSAL